MTSPEAREKLRAQLLRDEGWRPHPYLDCCGKPWRECRCAKPGRLTVGVGRNLDDVPLAMHEGAYLLDSDIRTATADVLAALAWALRLDEARLGVLIAMRFNLGLAGLLGFRKMLDAAERGEWEEAARHGLDSKWKKQVGLRADRLMRQLVTGEWS